MAFLGRWLAESVVLALSLLAAGLCMQIPAVTHGYLAAVLQVAQESRHDIDQREAAARQYYHLAADTDDALLAALRPLEPSNADALARSIDHARSLQAAYDRIAGTPALTQPVIAALDVADDPNGGKRAILETALGTYVPEIIFTLSGGIYALFGLILGSLIGHLLALPLRRERYPARAF